MHQLDNTGSSQPLIFINTLVDYATVGEQYKNGTLRQDAGRWYFPGQAIGKKILFGLKISVVPGPDLITRAAQNLIELTKLNRIVVSADAMSSVDRRIEIRTRVWFEAHQAFDDLNAVMLMPVGLAKTAMQEIIKRHVRERIKATGCWIVWLSVLQAKGYREANAIMREALVGTVNRDWTL
ncbi:MAG: hypothetical protein NTX45_00320 [Proteobacteria bacterium]|nr:hypothetical protein [Pseudomonadota bacterium]